MDDIRRTSMIIVNLDDLVSDSRRTAFTKEHLWSGHEEMGLLHRDEPG